MSDQSDPSARATSQYANTSDLLSLRVALLSHDTAPQPWYLWQSPRLAIAGDVLEVGAGTGELWRHVDASGARSLTLTDFSAAMCAQLRAAVSPQPTSNSTSSPSETSLAPSIAPPNATVDVQQCSATDLVSRLGAARFDLLIANHMLYHVDSPSAALAQFAAALRPGGRLRLALNGRDHIAELLELGEAVGRPSPILGAARVTAETAAALIEAAGFVDVKSERFPGEFEVMEPGPVVGYLESWAEERMTEGQVAEVRRRVEERIGREGSYRVRKHMVLFSAVKP